MPFRETREMLLLAYDGKIISDEEFLGLWESCHFKNPDFPHSSYTRFDLEDIDEAECLAEFRVDYRACSIFPGLSPRFCHGLDCLS